MAVVVPFYAVCFIASLVAAKGDVSMPPGYELCNGNLVDPNDVNYIVSANDGLTVLTSTDAETLRSVTGMYYATAFPQWLPPKNYMCFGHASCKNSLADGDCIHCVAVAVGYLLEACKERIGGQIQLPECKARYDPYNFTE